MTKQPTRSIPVRLRPEVADTIKASAKRKGISFNLQVNQILRDFLKEALGAPNAHESQEESSY